MQLFSTILNLKPSLTKEMFMDLVKEWNDTQMFEENRIADLEYHGEKDMTWGDSRLWLCVREYTAENILAIRYEKHEEDGTVWDTDYVMNFHTSSLSIRLERSYQENALRVDARFSTPYFIALLIRKGWLVKDDVLEISDQPYELNDELIPLLSAVVKRESSFSLPVVYISRTYYDEDPVDLHKLSRQLRGIAHVLAEKSVFDNEKIRKACDDRNAYYGAADLFFPNRALDPIRFFYHAEKGEDLTLREKIIRKVNEYSGSILLKPLETWNGINHAVVLERMSEQTILLNEAERSRQAAEHEVEDVYSAFSEDLEKLKKQVEELSVQASLMEYENQKLREKLRQSEDLPVLLSGKEEEFFSGEIREMVLDILNEKLANLPAESRRAHVVKDLIEKNEYQEVHKERAQKVKTMFKDYKSMSSVMSQSLADIGFSVSEEGKHYRLCYYGDPRYKTTIAKSGSDYREGRNIAALIIRQFM